MELPQLEIEKVVEHIHEKLYWYFDNMPEANKELIRKIIEELLTYYEQTQTPGTPSQSESKPPAEELRNPYDE